MTAKCTVICCCRNSLHSAADDFFLHSARLLKSRKKTEPSNEWLQQLPHKARKLEERLYRAAPSLSAYQDLSTLKDRLQMVAQMITNQYAAAKSRHSFVSGARRMSALYALRNSFSATQQRNSAPEALLSMSSQVASSGIAQNNSEGGLAPMLDSSGISENQSLASFQNSTMAGTAIVGATPNQGTTTSARANNPQIHSGTVGHQYQQQQQQIQGDGNAASGNSTSIAMLEQQKALNEQLRIQIQENLRRQNEWFRQMQAQQQSQQRSNSNNNATQPLEEQRSSAAAEVTPHAGVAGALGEQPQQNNPQSLAYLKDDVATTPMANMTKNMTAMGIVAGSQQGANMQHAGVAGFPFGAQASAAALMNDPTAAARLQALLLQQKQQQQLNGVHNPMNMLSSRIQQQQQQIPQQQLPQGLALGQQQQFPQSQQQQQLMENILRGPSVVPNATGKSYSSSSIPQQQVSREVAGSESSQSNRPMPPPAIVPKVNANDDGGAAAAGGGAKQPQDPVDRPLSPSSFHW